MRALAFNHCILSSILGTCVICGFSSLVFSPASNFCFSVRVLRTFPCGNFCCMCMIMWHSYLNDMEILETKPFISKGFELDTTLS